MSEHHDITFTLNGKPVSATVEARLNLADFLRHTLRLTGTHVGCEHGFCGACSAMNDSGGWIGRGTPRREAKRLAEGRGRYTDDLEMANVGHIAFLRSPHPHARIRRFDGAAAGKSPGVIALVTGDDLAAICKPWQTQLALFPGHSSPPQYPLAGGEVCWQGEAVAAVV